MGNEFGGSNVNIIHGRILQFLESCFVNDHVEKGDASCLGSNVHGVIIKQGFLFCFCFVHCVSIGRHFDDVAMPGNFGEDDEVHPFLHFLSATSLAFMPRRLLLLAT